MKIKQTLSFQKSIKKLHLNQKKDLDKAVKEIVKNPSIGQEKKADLSQVRVIKFKMEKFLILFAYIWKIDEDEIVLLKLGAINN